MTQNIRAHIIVIGNEKGGTGKSTIAMHLAVKLLQENFRVAVLDLDGRQGSLSKYIANREEFCRKHDLSLPTPVHYRFAPCEDAAQIPAHIAEIQALVDRLSTEFDALVIDTPGTKNYLFDAAHRQADTLITPITDSLVDLSAVADIDFDSGKIKTPGHYAEFVWDIKKVLAAQGRPYLNWIVCGNKISTLRSKNKNFVFEHLEKISKLYGFRLCEGLKDRVVYRELFLEGLTVLDLQHEALRRRMSLSHLAAKMEIKNLAEFICP